MTHLQLTPVPVPADLLDGVTQDVARKDGRLVQVHDLTLGLDPGLQGTLNGQVHLDLLRAEGVVHDADVDARVLHQQLVDDQHLQVVLDAGRGQDLPETRPLSPIPTGKRIYLYL